LKRRPYGSNGNTTGRRIHETPAEELETHCTCNGRVSEEHKMTIRQKEMKHIRTKGWQPRMARKQKYPVESTLKEVR